MEDYGRRVKAQIFPTLGLGKLIFCVCVCVCVCVYVCVLIGKC